ncbi:MAG TPA: multifunctional CCA tRNA nucleotidyl transferase/2'3'-cyclic phosphodiesterase/2'nucleotidase/phosphatase [Gammaproteobacteria bacterium]|jgi:tRNA nucleotidyltransferase (CCA-adding enzyme)|nr:multifunctional CCA tRNA nucleotidyl transferase/2'3'-cyclic phosphodiesterase/2'nucleotidase/phosphatase [Gammaproteobacteria bacterium]
MEIYLVGGAIRDRLLDLPSGEKDWVVVHATPSEMKHLGYKQVGKSFPVFIHPETGEEYALARKEVKTGTGYHGFDFDANPDITLEEDLSRRDLTINAIAENKDGEIIDPFKGREDLSKRVLRHVSEAFKEDPLRVLRIARFRAKLFNLDFNIADETKQLVAKIVASGELSSLVPERVWMETKKALNESRFDQYFKTLIEFGAFDQIYPDLSGIDKDFFSQSIFQEASQANISSRYRFAAIFLALMEQEQESIKDRVESMQNNMNLPNKFKELPLQIDQSMSLISKDIEQYNAEYILTLLETLDVVRRPDHLEDVIAVITLGQGQGLDEKIALLQKSADLARSIKISNLREDGLDGNVIGKKIRELRLKKIEEELAK